jgi:hypothetical protein
MPADGGAFFRHQYFEIYPAPFTPVKIDAASVPIDNDGTDDVKA